MKNKNIEIKSKKEYHEMMVTIYNLMNKGNGKLTKAETIKLTEISIATEYYEDHILGLKLVKEPKSIQEVVELKLFENKMTKAKLAEEMGLAKSKVSEILNGKRKADITFIKGVHKVLKIDAKLLLEIAQRN